MIKTLSSFFLLFTVVCSIILVSTSSSTVSAGATTLYYVSSSYGNDNNQGTSPSFPFASLDKVSALSSSLQPGDKVLLYATDTWIIDYGWNLTMMLGTSVAPITIGSYYTQTAVTNVERPIIQRNPHVPAVGPTILVSGSTGIVIEGISVRGGENGIAFVWDIKNNQPTTYDSIQVQDCTFWDIKGLSYNGTTGSWWGSAIALAAAHAGVTVTNVAINNNLCNNSDTFYINTVPWEPGNWTRAYVFKLYMGNNTITAASFNTLFLDTTNYVTVTGNVFLRNTPSELFLYGTTDIIMGTLDETNTLIDNEIGYRGEYQPGGPDGCAVDFETSATGVQFNENYVHHSFGAGIMVFGHQTTSQNLTFRNNRMLWNGCNQTRGDQGNIAFLHLNSSGQIYDNVFTPCPDNKPPVFNPLQPSVLNNWNIYNNVIDTLNGTVQVLLTPVVTRIVNPNNITIQVTDPNTNNNNNNGNTIIRYTTNGSKPRTDSLIFPSNGILTLPLRSVSVMVKIFPTNQYMEAMENQGITVVESAAEGGIYSPPN